MANKINLETYYRLRQERQRLARQPRQYCVRCKKTMATCYCAGIQPFSSHPKFVILIHREEIRRSVATGRMAHLCLSNSEFYEGLDFTHHDKVNSLIQSPEHKCMLLYPGQDSINLSGLKLEEIKTLAEVPANKKMLTVFVIDGTWAQSRRIKRLSRNLSSLPTISFTPPSPSGFYVRKQPQAHFYSTIEAIHQVISLLDAKGSSAHENLLDTFQYMVNQQIAYGVKYGSPRGFRPIRGERQREEPPALVEG